MGSILVSEKYFKIFQTIIIVKHFVVTWKKLIADIWNFQQSASKHYDNFEVF